MYAEYKMMMSILSFCFNFQMNIKTVLNTENTLKNTQIRFDFIFR